MADYDALVKELKNVAGYAPAYQSSYTIKYGTATATYTITGVTEDFTEVRTYTLAQGRQLTQADRLSKGGLRFWDLRLPLISSAPSIPLGVTLQDPTALHLPWSVCSSQKAHLGLPVGMTWY